MTAHTARFWIHAALRCLCFDTPHHIFCSLIKQEFLPLFYFLFIYFFSFFGRTEFSEETFRGEIFRKGFFAVNFNSTTDSMLQMFAKDAILELLQLKIKVVLAENSK